MKKALTIASAAFLMIAPASAQTLTGAYATEGSNPGGGGYTGTTELFGSGPVYVVEQRIAGSVLEGIGIQSGSALSITYNAGGEIYISAYELQGDGSLVGSWTALGQEEVGAETLTPQ